MTLKKIPFWHTRLAGSPETIPYSSGSIFKYHTPAVKNLGGISSSTLLEGHARHLAHALALYGEHTPPHVVLVGHGYGGLICEQTIVSLNSTSKQSPYRSAQTRIRGLILFGTPHFRAGLAQWVILTAKRLGIECKMTASKQNWSSCTHHFTAITEMQTKFCDIFTEPANGTRTVCCFAEHPDPVTKLTISSEWCIVPRVRPIAIPSSHFEMTSFRSPDQNDSPDQTEPSDQALNRVIALMVKMASELKKNKVLYDDSFDVKGFAGSSWRNDPALEWDPRSLGLYFIISSKSSASGDVALGNVIVSSDNPSRTIATRSDVRVTSDQSMDFGASQRITNSYEPWRALVSPLFKDNEFKHIVREEWSRDRAVEYLKAASQMKALKEQLMTTDPRFYLITGIILGVTATDSSKVVGYRVSYVSLERDEEGDSSSDETSNLMLVIREVKARSLNEIDENPPEIAEEPSQKKTEKERQKDVEKHSTDVEKHSTAGRPQSPLKNAARQVKNAPAKIIEKGWVVFKQ